MFVTLKYGDDTIKFFYWESIVDEALRLLFRSCFVLVLVTATIGCKSKLTGGDDIKNATAVSFQELKDVVGVGTTFYLVGRENEFHYFETPEGFYRLTTDFDIPMFKSRVDRSELGTLRIPVVISDSRIILAQPDRKKS